MTTNAIYRCEEFENAGAASSDYDEIGESQYDDLADDFREKTAVYLEIIGDECDAGSKAPLPSPSPRPVTECRDQARDYEALREETPNHAYLHVPNEKTERCDEGANAEDQIV